jgi:hypothetical protein
VAASTIESRPLSTPAEDLEHAGFGERLPVPGPVAGVQAPAELVDQTHDRHLVDERGQTGVRYLRAHQALWFSTVST